MANADQSPSEAQDPEPTAYAYDAPGLSPKQFLLRVMHAPDAAIRDRVRAASELLRLYPRDWDPPVLTYRIGGIPECHSLSTSSDPRPTDERLGNSSHSRDFAHKGPTRMTDDPRPLNIETTIISEIKSDNYPQPTLCTICGHYMPYPCSTTKN